MQDELDDSDCEIVGDGKPFIGEITEAPKYLRENDDIIRGYRINYKTPYLATKSIFCLHNECVNIWSHLIGVGAFILIGVYLIITLTPPALAGTGLIHSWLSTP